MPGAFVDKKVTSKGLNGRNAEQQQQLDQVLDYVDLGGKVSSKSFIAGQAERDAGTAAAQAGTSNKQKRKKDILSRTLLGGDPVSQKSILGG